MYLLCSPAAAGPVPGCYRLRPAEAGSGLPGWTVAVQLANPQPQLPRHPAPPTLSLASATLCQSHCLAGGDKQVEKKSLKLNWQVPWRGKHRNVTRTQLGLKCLFFLLLFSSPGMECIQINSICYEMIHIKKLWHDMWKNIKSEAHAHRHQLIPPLGSGHGCLQRGWWGWI